MIAVLAINILIAASCSLGDVQAVVDLAQSADTVEVPAGRCVWDVPGLHVPINKTIALHGSATIITLGTGYAVGVVGKDSLIQVDSNDSRISSFVLERPPADITRAHLIKVTGQRVRVDHNFCSNLSTLNSIDCPWYAQGGSGVADHNTFANARTVVYGNPKTSWTVPSIIGADPVGAVVIEDNLYLKSVSGNLLDCEDGGRYVFRHNEVRTSALQEDVHAHSYQVGIRGCRSWEVYDNHFIGSLKPYAAIWMRGGTGVIFDNVVEGTYPNGILFDNVTSFQDRGGPTGKCLEWPCIDQIGRGMNQSDEPAYVWGNTINGVVANPRVVNCSSAVKPNGSCADIQVGRDYMISVTKPGYTPLPYPHPLNQ